MAADAAGAKVTVGTIMRSLRKRSVPADFLNRTEFDIMDRKLEAECRLYGTDESYDNLEVSLRLFDNSPLLEFLLPSPPSLHHQPFLQPQLSPPTPTSRLLTIVFHFNHPYHSYPTVTPSLILICPTTTHPLPNLSTVNIS